MRTRLRLPLFAVVLSVQVGAWDNLRAEYVGSASVVSPNAAIESAALEVLGTGGGTIAFAYRGGGNAVDAAVAAALAACVVTPQACSLGGYGGHMMICRSGWDGEPALVTCIDFNTAAGSLATSNLFAGDVNPLNALWTGPQPPANLYGWKAVGVPGTLAGLVMAQTNYGRKISGTNYLPFAEVLKPALARVADGRATGNAYYTLTSVSNLLMDLYTNSPGYLDQTGTPNPNSLNDPCAVFYSGDIARDIAAAMTANGGLVTYQDLTTYRPREVAPCYRHFQCPGGTPATVYVAPLGSAGISVLQELTILEALGWTNGPEGKWDSLQYWHSRAQAARMIWKDHFQWLGDPASGVLPPDFLGNGSTSFCDQLLAHVSHGYPYPCPSDPDEFPLTNAIAGSIQDAVNSSTNLPVLIHWNDIRYGTCNIATADKWGNCVALTLSMGGGFGAQVALTNRGLVFGQGMALFDPRPGWPNSIAPGKRPVNNMAPAIVVPDYPFSPTNRLPGGRPPLAIGGVGGSTIENNLAMQLIQYLTDPPSRALSAPSTWLYNFEANNVIYMRPSYPPGVQDYFAAIGLSTPGSPPSAGQLSQAQAWIAPTIITPPADTNTIPGGTVMFSVAAAGLPLFYQWFQDGAPLADGGPVSGARTPQLTIASVSRSGTCFVVITNGAATVTSAPAALHLDLPASPGQILYEPFDYANVGGPASSNTPANWTYGGTGANDLSVVSGNLAYPGLATAIGNSVTNGGAGLGVRRLLGTNFSSGQIYFSALLRINDLGFGMWSGQSSCLGALTATDNTSFCLQVLVKSNSPSAYGIGTQKSGAGATATFDTTEHSPAEVLFLVGKYDFTTTPNTATLWINPPWPTFGPASEPPSGSISATAGTDGFTIDRFNLRQNAPTGPFSVPAAIQWDELRFGLSWASVTPPAAASPLVQLTDFARLADGTFQFAYSNLAARTYTVFASTNLLHWTALGTPAEISPGCFQFRDSDATNLPHRFYELRQ